MTDDKRKPGRPMLPPADKLSVMTLRLTEAQKAKLQRIGVQRLRDWLDRVRELMAASKQELMSLNLGMLNPEKRPSREFLVRTNADYVAWCKNHYQPDALDELDMASFHGLWAWQEQEKRLAEAVSAERELIAQWLEVQRIEIPATGPEFAQALRICGPVSGVEK